MKRLQFSVERELAEALHRQARIEGTSKAALARRYLRERLLPLPAGESDPLWAFFGSAEGEPGDSESVDNVVCGRGTAASGDPRKAAARRILAAEPMPVPATVEELRTELGRSPGGA